ncbi:major facilitator transporter [Arthrobacter nitrophenolicus]|uniref:Major facilitator transporter n=1 Tax=Arthrobacter nitrophenolicus TaxID=683150 RepID=L8TS66_9MICC|nr:major facilitator transporter [Arthrobacter nitrophenolicus]
MPGWMRLGPATAPTVTAQTTVDRALPRCSASARSTAANLACRFAAVPTPMPAAPSTSRTKIPVTTARTISTVPARAAERPASWPIRRPLRSASEASGRAASAAPRVMTVATAPAHALEPDSSTARIEPMDTVAPVPIPPKTWAAASRATVRRCTRRTSSSVITVGAMDRA